MSSGGGGEVGRGGGTDTFLIGIVLGGGILGGGGSDMVGGRLLSTFAMDDSEEDVITSGAVLSCLWSALLLIDVVRARTLANSRTGDLTTLAARARGEEVAFGGDEGMNWNGCAVGPRWNVIVLEALMEGEGGL